MKLNESEGEKTMKCAVCNKTLDSDINKDYPFYFEFHMDNKVVNCCMNNDCRQETYTLLSHSNSEMSIELKSVIKSNKPTKILNGHGHFRCSSSFDKTIEPNKHIITIEIADVFVVKNVKDNKKDIMVNEMVQRFRKELNAIFDSVE